MIVGTGKVEQNGQTRMTQEVQEKCKKDQQTTEVRNKVYTTNLTEKHYQRILVLFLYLIQKFGSTQMFNTNINVQLKASGKRH